MSKKDPFAKTATAYGLEFHKPEHLVAVALRQHAERLCKEPDQVPVEEARALDRALRSCSGISDIDRVWVRWGFVGEPRGWITTDEMKYHRKGKRDVTYVYPVAKPSPT